MTHSTGIPAVGTTSAAPQTAATRAPASGVAVVMAALALVAWGALAFGAVYPWAYVPLAVASAILGGVALWRAGRLPRETRRLGAALLVVGVAASAQLVPLPSAVRLAFSPGSDAVYREIDLGFAISSQAAAASGATIWRPFSIDPAAGGRALLLLAGFALLLVGLSGVLRLTGTNALVTGLVAFGFVLAAIGILQKATLGDHAFAGMKIYGLWAPEYKLTTPFGPFVNKNHFAGWMLMVLPLAVGYVLGLAHVGMHRLRPGWRNRVLWVSSPDGARVQLAAFAIVVMAASLMMTASRSGVGCFLVAMTIAAAVGVRQQSSRRARAIVIVLLGALAVLPVLSANASLAQRFERGFNDPSVQLRLDAWSQTVSILRDVPLTGTGLNTFGHAALRYQSAGSELRFRESHNDYLQLAAEGGLLVGVPAAIAVALFGAAVRRRFSDDTPDELTYWVRFGACTGIVAIALQSTVEFSLQMPGNAVLVAVLAAIALHAPGPGARSASLHARPHPLARSR